MTGNTGGTGSAVAHGETGLRVDGENVGEIASALTKYLLDAELAKTTGQKGRERVIKTFTQDRRVERLRNLMN